MTLAEARELLDLPTDADEDDVERQYRARLNELRIQVDHAVDRGHREVAQRALRELGLAREVLTQWLRSLPGTGPARACPSCGKVCSADGRFCQRCGAPLLSTFDGSSLPATVLERLKLRGYDVRRELVRGDRSVLWEGVDHIGHRIVVKFLQPALAADPSRRQEFIDRAIAQSRLVHDHIVPVLDVDAAAELPWYMQPLIRGVSVHEVCLDKQLFDYRAAAKTIATVGMTLQYVHDLGVVHGRLTPRHMLLQRQFTPIVNGFGSRVTRGGMVGRPVYLHPRHFLSDANLQPDPVDDLFALGWILFEMLTSEPPFRADDLLSHVRIDVEPGLARLHERRPDVPGGFSEVIRRAMNWEPDVRYPTAAALAEAVGALT